MLHYFLYGTWDIITEIVCVSKDCLTYSLTAVPCNIILIMIWCILERPTLQYTKLKYTCDLNYCSCKLFQPYECTVNCTFFFRIVNCTFINLRMNCYWMWRMEIIAHFLFMCLFYFNWLMSWGVMYFHSCGAV